MKTQLNKLIGFLPKKQSMQPTVLLVFRIAMLSVILKWPLGLITCITPPPCIGLLVKTSQMPVRPSVLFQHFQNIKTPRPPGRGRWNSMIFYYSIGSWNLLPESGILDFGRCCAGGHHELGPVGRLRLPTPSGVIFSTRKLNGIKYACLRVYTRWTNYLYAAMHFPNVNNVWIIEIPKTSY